MNFNELFDRLVKAVQNNDKKMLEETIYCIVRYICNEMHQNFEAKHISLEDVIKLGEHSFMFALNNTINFSTELIFEIKRKILASKEYKEDYQYYNSVTFSMYLINSILHELCHCKQYKDYEQGILNNQAYLNSLSYSMITFQKIHYLDASHEGDAYGNGVGLMKELCSEKYIKNEDYLKQYASQNNSDKFNFFTYNTLFNEMVYYLDRIPFMKNEDGKFYDIYTYSSIFISKLDSRYRKILMSRTPLISIGIEEEKQKCRLKKPDELIEQYLYKKIKFSNNTSEITSKEADTLLDAYIYLLIPQLNEKNYRELCEKYGKNDIEKILIDLLKKIEESISLYNLCYQNSIKRIEKIIKKENHTLLQDIDVKYARTKYETAISFLNECKDIIKNIGFEKQQKTF